jgi:uncharacterized protein Yka (UPF0111/DUF47 family)
VTHRRWFLPDTPDVLGMLRTQIAVTAEGMDALRAWAGGEKAAADRVRAAEHRADDAKRDLWRSLRNAFTTPVDAEDLFQLSAELDEVLNGAKEVVRAAEVLSVEPDDAVRAMVDLIGEGVAHVGDALAALGTDADAATAAADAAVKSQRRAEHLSRDLMPELVRRDDTRLALARVDVYHRLGEVSDRLVRVADRVWYTVVKEA